MPCMKTSDRLATILFLLAAPAARFLELKNNYDPAGLPTGGFPYLPAVLAAAAVVFLLALRPLAELPHHDMADHFALYTSMAFLRISMARSIFSASRT